MSDQKHLMDLVAHFGEACRQLGFAEAACFAPYPPEKAILDRDYWSMEVQDRLDAIHKWESAQLDRELANTKESGAMLLKAILSGVISAPKVLPLPGAVD